MRIGGGVSLLFWGALYARYRRNKKLYKTQGHGPLPKGAAINPRWELLEPGDLILTSGRIATRLHESVGHGEIVLRMLDGVMMAFSSYMEKGTIFNPLQDVADQKTTRGHYIVMRPVQKWTDDESDLAARVALKMLEQNKRYIAQTTADRSELIGKLPVPGFVKRFLLGKLKVTGYDWLGLFTGRRAPDRWTCIGACMELCWRVGINIRWYGTGLLGLGTGLLDPIMPDRFLTDPAFRLITEDEVKAWEAAHGTESGTAQ